MMYTRLQNFTNVMVGEHETQILKVVLVVLVVLLLLFDVLAPTKAHVLSYFRQMVCPKILNCQFITTTRIS